MTESQAKILVVDDEEKNVKLMEAMLLPRGYEIVKAYNGEEALQQVEKETPDLILLDVMMPVINGFDVCKKLKDDPETRLIPIVIMTALDAVEDRCEQRARHRHFGQLKRHVVRMPNYFGPYVDHLVP